MPPDLNSTEKLFEKHSSKSYNPKLANVFFKSGMIKIWGIWFDKVRKACVKDNGRLPEYNISASGIVVLCNACDKYMELLKTEGDLHHGQSVQDSDQDGHDMVGMILNYCKEPKFLSEIREGNLSLTVRQVLN